MAPSIRYNVPTRASSFVGRTTELAELEELVSGPGLITLWGPPGVGKSRLALEVARRAPAGTDVCWVDLAPLSGDGAVLDAIGRAAGVHERPERSLLDGVVAHFGARPTRLVLDNCEHVLDECSVLADTLLRRCPRLTVIATSREPLRTEAERRWPVPALSARDSTELFYARASAGTVGFAVDDESSAAIRTICERLEGIPLALELAAGRVGLVSPVEIAALLDTDPLDVLAGGNRDLSGRHETLGAAIGQSYDALSEAERAVLDRLSVFRGGCSLTEARAVCPGGAVAAKSVPRLLRSLVDKSLVVRRRRGRSNRYELLDAIRHYAAEHLDLRGEEPDVAARHAGAFVQVAARVEQGLTGPTQLAALAMADAEHDNLAAAFAWALVHDPVRALRISASMTIWWMTRGRLSEGIGQLGAALEASPSAPPALRARGLWGLGLLAHTSGRDPEAVSSVTESIELARRHGDPSTEARAQAALAEMLRWDDSQRALVLAGESARLAKRVGDNWCVVHALLVAGNICVTSGRRRDARHFFDDAVARARNHNDIQALSVALNLRARAALYDYDEPTARCHAQEARSHAEALRDPIGAAIALATVAELDNSRGRHRRARSALRRSAALISQAGALSELRDVEAGLAVVALALDDLAAAETHLREELRLSRLSGRSTARALQGLGVLAFKQGHLDAADALSGRAVAEARRRGSGIVEAGATADMAEFAMGQGQLERAARLWRQALSLAHDAGMTPLVMIAMESLATVTSESESPAGAVTLFGASQAIHDSSGCPRGRRQAARMTLCISMLRRELSPAEFDVAWTRGYERSEDEAVASALRSRRREAGASSGWSSLTGAEEAVVGLVRLGRSNDEIAEQLGVSRNTVRTHLSRVLTKLGISSRAKLAHSAAAAQTANLAD